MTRIAKTGRAFSLVEVVIAIAIVTFGIISIMGLCSISFTAVREITNQGEAYGVSQALPAYLQATGFTNVYASIQAGTATNIYAYTTNNCVVIDTGTAADMSPATIANRNGRLFNISLTLSTNAPLVLSTNTASSTPTYNYAQSNLPTSGLPDGGTGYGDVCLAINVKVYSISQIPAPASMTNNPPALNYDTVLSR